MEYIDKSTFNKLNLSAQVKIFNSFLKEHDNIKSVCSKLNISYSTIRDRFAKGNYSYNKFKNQYESINNFKNTDELDILIEGIIHKLNKKEKIPLMNSKVKQESDIILRSFRIYEHILNDFVEYCDNANLKQYNVISLFIHEGLQKYGQKK